MRLRPTRAGFRWFMVGLGIVLFLFNSTTSAYLLYRHNGDLHTISVNGETIKNQGNEILKIENRVSTENQNLIAAGKEQEAFAAWIVLGQQTNCGNQSLIAATLGITTAKPCPIVPSFAPLPGTK